MKKTTFFLVLFFLFGFGLALPAVAENDKADDNTKVKIEKLGTTEIAPVYEPRAVTVKGRVTIVSSSTLPADLTVALDSIAPKKLKNFPGIFPTKGTVLAVHLTVDTKLVRKYSGRADFSELAVGDSVSITGRLQADGSVSASMVKDQSEQATFNAKRGTVLSIDVEGKTFVVKNGDKEYKVFVTLATKFTKDNGESVAFLDLHVGDWVAVRGVVRRATSEINADSVVIKVLEKDRDVKKLEQQRINMERKITALKATLAKAQAELEALIKRLFDLRGPTSTPAVQ